MSNKKSERVELQPFGLHRTELFFYFPAPGAFLCYPACLSHAHAVYSKGDPEELEVCLCVG